MSLWSARVRTRCGVTSTIQGRGQLMVDEITGPADALAEQLEGPDPFRAFIDALTNQQIACGLMVTAARDQAHYEAETRANDALSSWLTGKSAFRRLQIQAREAPESTSLQELGLIAASLDSMASRFDEQLNLASQRSKDPTSRGVLCQLRQSLAILRVADVLGPGIRHVAAPATAGDST